MRTSIACFLLLTGCATAPPPKQDPVLQSQITQFYASPAKVPKGERTLLCYGVEYTATVTLDPGNESLSPALTKCIEKIPTADTTYTLTAKGKDGQTHTKTVAVTAIGSKLKFLDLVVNAPQVKAGEPVSFGFKAQGATEVQGSPGKFQKGGQASGDCLIDQPKQTTTYEITIRGAGNQIDTEKMTVKVIP